ncbi:MAG: helix-turn-helix domain-containing protein [Brevundimonas sp.]|uniref:helix-turn-helix domain-containing protein n=1 Tax=Brevundimonas sp. TaxID=1871086 RepID=UPI002488230D|nr:helix-turn-helix domain-containing protein [Brevundimonas sp.]MDI1326115.1 helix-turn-helix domain-containing protein [Brevundimonas sp.]
MSERFSFNSDALPREEAFQAYALLYNNGSDVTRGEGEFRAEVRAWRLEGLLLFERRLSGVVHSRGARAGTDGFDHIVLSLVLSGRVTGGQASGFGEAVAGEIYVTDTSRPSRTAFESAHVLTASVSKEIIEAARGGIAGLHGRILKPPRNLMLADYLQSLARNGDAIETEAQPGLSRAFIHVLASVEDKGVRGSEARRGEYLRRDAVERMIIENLGDACLSVATLSRGMGMSRSALYRLFEDYGGVARLIQKRRLDGVRQALDNREPAQVADLARTFGFTDEAQLSRLFREAYEVSPQAYREEVAASRPDDPVDSRRRWAGWMGELS